MIDPLESKILDINAEALGISIDLLMENAGKAIANLINTEFPDKKVLFVCGPTNNGGDGMAAASLVKKSTVALLYPPEMIRTEAARNRLGMLKSKPKMFDDIYLTDYDVLVDCVTGIGFKGTPREQVANYIKDVNNLFKGTVISADVPTGFGSATAVRPDITITFDDVKEGMNEETCGRILLADIGIPDGAYDSVGPGDLLRYPVPDKDSHKGQNGRLLVIGGGPYIGAPALSALGALRVGVDLVRIATPSASFPHIASFTPNFVMHELPGDVLTHDHVFMLKELSEKVHAVLIGPGLGAAPETMDAVAEFIRICEKPMIIDADAISAIGDVQFDVPVVITPHHAELERMLSASNDKSAADFATNRGDDITIVTKGSVDEIANGERIRKNLTGTSGMTVGGTGDVLSGVIAGLLAKGMTAFDAGCLGSYINGRAGEIAFDKFSYGLLATDIIDSVPAVLKEMK